MFRFRGENGLNLEVSGGFLCFEQVEGPKICPSVSYEIASNRRSFHYLGFDHRELPTAVLIDRDLRMR